MVAGLTDHVWSMEEMIRYPIPPADTLTVPRPRRRRTRGDGTIIPFPTVRTRSPHSPPGRVA